MLTRDYYTIDIPGDAYDNMDDVDNAAINEARERAKLYVIPCGWHIVRRTGELGDWNIKVRVCRTRNKASK